MKSFLICDGDKTIQIYSDGIAVATYDKATKDLDIHTKSIEKFNEVQNSFHAAALLLSLNKFKFEQPIEDKTEKTITTDGKSFTVIT